MQREEVKAALRAWGIALENRFAVCKADRSIHMLDKARDLAPGSRENAVRLLVDRDGRSRLRTMARAASTDKLKLSILPKWSCEPVRAANDADRPHDNPEIAFDQGIPDDLRWVDAAVNSIERQNPLRALVVRTEYTVSASQKVKARMVAETYGGKFTKDMYRRELDKAIEVIGWERARVA
ncbi:MAG TPA: hypothetical protein VLC71_05985 [Thermomonas sp.]|nr:hypothetical protein [Thermomonas sp.]